MLKYENCLKAYKNSETSNNFSSSLSYISLHFSKTKFDVFLFCSGGEDIFFHTSTSPKRPKTKAYILTSEQAPASAAVAVVSDDNTAVTTTDYTEIDRCLCSDEADDSAKSYTLLSDLRLNVSVLLGYRFCGALKESISINMLSVSRLHTCYALLMFFRSIMDESHLDVSPNFFH